MSRKRLLRARESAELSGIEVIEVIETAGVSTR